MGEETIATTLSQAVFLIMAMAVHQATKSVAAAKPQQPAVPLHWSLKSSLLVPICAQMAVMATTVSSLERLRSVEVCAVTAEGITATMLNQAVFPIMAMAVLQATKSVAAARPVKRSDEETQLEQQPLRGPYVCVF